MNYIFAYFEDLFADLNRSWIDIITDKYKSSGQNLASISKYRRFPVTTAVILQSIDELWFQEYKYANMSYINKFTLNP